MSLKFKPEDFDEFWNGSYPQGMSQRSAIAYFANVRFEAWIKENGKEVYEFKNKSGWYETQALIDSRPCHKAILINIEPFEKCAHPRENIKWRSGPSVGNIFYCSCGVVVQPKEFEEVNE